jgi:hypothetical protein
MANSVSKSTTFLGFLICSNCSRSK